MWHILRCYLTGRHDYGVGCEPGAIFLRCVHCGHRSTGWNVDTRETAVPTRPVAIPVAVPASSGSAFTRSAPPRLHRVPVAPMTARVIPFQRTVTS